jgi:hypothetical protein
MSVRYKVWVYRLTQDFSKTFVRLQEEKNEYLILSPLFFAETSWNAPHQP